MIKSPKPYRLFELYTIMKPYIESMNTVCGENGNINDIPVLSMNYIKEMSKMDIQMRTLYINLISVLAALGYTIINKIDLNDLDDTKNKTGDSKESVESAENEDRYIGIAIKKMTEQDYFSIPSYYKRRTEQLMNYLNYLEERGELNVQNRQVDIQKDDTQEMN